MSTNEPIVVGEKWDEIFGKNTNQPQNSNVSLLSQPVSFINSRNQRQVRIFNGDPRDWALFIASLKFHVHDAVQDDGYRVNALRDALASHVANRIIHLLRDSSTYFVALESLKMKYGHPFLIVQGHIDALLDLP